MHLLLIVYHAFSGIILPKWMTGDRAMRKQRIRTLALTALAGVIILASAFQPTASAGQSVGDMGTPSASSVGTPAAPASRPQTNNVVAQGGGYSCVDATTASNELGGHQTIVSNDSDHCVATEDPGFSSPANYEWRQCPVTPDAWICIWIESGDQWVIYKADDSTLKWAERNQSRLLAAYGSNDPVQDPCSALAHFKVSRPNLKPGNFTCSSPTATNTPTMTPTTQPGSPTATRTPTVTQTPKATATATQLPACDRRARPDIHVTSVKTDANTITAQVSVDRSDPRIANNNLQRVNFTALENASVDIHNVHNRVFTDEREPFWFSPEAGTQNATIVVHRLGAGAFKVVVVLRDNCGDLPTFVGGGTGF